MLKAEVIKVVITLKDYKEIRQRFLAGESQRSIAKAMHISRNTVAKYCQGEAVPWVAQVAHFLISESGSFFS